MPVIRISDATFTDLKVMSAWFETKTPSDTLDRVIAEMMEHLGLERDAQQEAPATEGVMRFDTAPGLSFTRVLGAKVAGSPLGKPNWTGVLIAMIGEGKKQGLSSADLVRELQVPAHVGKQKDFGYRFHEDLGISVQGQSATDCWKEVSRLAKKWKVSVSVEFQWRENPKAQHPGKVAEITA